MITDNTRDRTGPARDDCKLQVIYVAGDGDYCRETGPANIRTHGGGAAWAQSHFNSIADREARARVTGYRLEWW